MLTSAQNSSESARGPDGDQESHLGPRAAAHGRVAEAARWARRTSEKWGASTSSPPEVARNAGISKDQQGQAVRAANVPAESLIEADNPATVMQLAEMTSICALYRPGDSGRH